MSVLRVLWEGEVPRNEFGTAGTTWTRIFERGGQTIAEYRWHGIASDERQIEEDEASRLVAHLARELAARDEALAALRAAARDYREAVIEERIARGESDRTPLHNPAYQCRRERYDKARGELVAAEARQLALLPADEPAEATP